jgi:hypothetical protein
VISSPLDHEAGLQKNVKPQLSLSVVVSERPGRQKMMSNQTQPVVLAASCVKGKDVEFRDF